MVNYKSQDNKQIKLATRQPTIGNLKLLEV